jgi:hypothetical protein
MNNFHLIVDETMPIKGYCEAAPESGRGTGQSAAPPFRQRPIK